jgi:acetoin utilization protein AcuB
MRVGDIMSTRLVSVHLDDSLEVIKEIFDSAEIHHLLVVADAELYGLISDRDLLRALSPFIGSNVESARDAATLNKRAHQIMTRKPRTLSPDADIKEAIDLLLHNGFSCLPVVDEQQTPVGILTWRDMLRYLAAAAPQDQTTPG